MPVVFEDYRDDREELGDLPVDPGTNAHAILSLLAANPEFGFTPTEIEEALDIPTGSVNPTLARLRERDLVEHESPYWSAVDDDRLAAFTGADGDGRDNRNSGDDADDGNDEDDAGDESDRGRGDSLEYLSADHPVRRRREWSRE